MDNKADKKRKNYEKKKEILKRVNDIIKAYLFDDDETFAKIDMYFEAGVSSQHKALHYGKPGEHTPDIYRGEPKGYLDGIYFINLGEILFPKIVWYYDPEFKKEWDGKTLSEIRKEKNNG